MDVIITPEKGLQAEIGQQLLGLAEDPNQVRWVSWPQAGYKVPVELAAKLSALRGDGGEDGVRSLSNTEQQAQTEVPRRRGRPRKQVVTETVPDTDDTVKEE